MPHLTWIEFILRIIPESFIIILAGYAIAKKTIIFKKYTISGVLLAVLIFSFRLLPIGAESHMLLGAVAGTFVLYTINKFKTIESILTVLICGLLVIFAEGINVLILTFFKGLNANEIFNEADAVTKTLYGLPSLIIFAFVVISSYFIRTRRTRA